MKVFLNNRYAQLAVVVLQRAFVRIMSLPLRRVEKLWQASGTNTFIYRCLFLLQRLSQYCCEDPLDVEWNSGQALIATLLCSWVRCASFPWRTTQSTTEHEVTGHSVFLSPPSFPSWCGFDKGKLACYRRGHASRHGATSNLFSETGGFMDSSRGAKVFLSHCFC